MEKPILIVLCGLQGSGKSTYAREHKTMAEVVSSDEIRIENNNNISNDKVFKEFYSRINYFLAHGKNVIADATNITIKSRKTFFQEIKIDCYKKIIIFNTPIEVCRERIIQRNEKGIQPPVPIDVLLRYYKNFEIPFYEEGWDEIEIFNKPTNSDSIAFADKLLGEAEDFNQKNHHHTLTLGKHMEMAGLYLEDKKEKEILICAAYYHDVGKLFTQKFDDNGEAHYYNHSNIGAYILLSKCGCFDEDHNYDVKETLNWIFYINYHMLPFDIIGKPKATAKWKKLFGEEKFHNLCILNEADAAAK